jgi:glycosyltransferase involved in cell wall biosynthesis
MPLTSIYGAVYNNSRYIESCLNSLIQALPDFDEYYELVVVDNYSTDGTFKILKNFAKKHRNVKLLQVKLNS